MTEPQNEKPQNYANHARFDPWFHFTLAPILIFLLISGVVGIVRANHNRHQHIVIAVGAFLLLWIVVRARTYSLRVQDRVIRLEERIRLSVLLPDPLRGRIPELTVQQLVALRFASDVEVPTLVEKTLAENLEPKAIKKSIQSWRPDHFRV
ncbi:MAG TPA: DUF6526 family protein [Acidisarcina sp.]